MNILTVTKENPLRMNGFRPLCIRCLSGALWITYRNGPDIIIGEGESLQLNRKRNLIIQSVSSVSETVLE